MIDAKDPLGFKKKEETAQREEMYEEQLRNSVIQAGMAGQQLPPETVAAFNNKLLTHDGQDLFYKTVRMVKEDGTEQDVLVPDPVMSIPKDFSMAQFDRRSGDRRNIMYVGEP